MAAIDALRRVLKAAEQVELLKRKLDTAEGELAAAIEVKDIKQAAAQALRAQVRQARLDFAAILEAELPELKT